MPLQSFLTFLESGPSPFHAVATCTSLLRAAGFTALCETDLLLPSTLVAGNKYYFTRNSSALVAFTVGKNYKQGNPFAIIGAHTDSPCLKIRY
jgi:aspartyl aminopeptidase